MIRKVNTAHYIHKSMVQGYGFFNSFRFIALLFFYADSFESENGISVSESGQPEDDDSYSVSGQFSYTAPDGVTYTVVYTAGEDGFQPQGDHLPTPVPTQYPTPEVADDDGDEEEEEEEQVRASDEEPQYERVIVGYRPRYN